MATFTVLPGRPMKQGASVTPEGVNFSIFSRNATRVILAFFEKPEDGFPFATVELTPEENRTGDIWHALIPEAKEGFLYLYRIEGPHLPQKGLRFDSSRYLLDPYAKALTDGSVFKFFASSPTRETDALYVKNREIPNVSLFPKCVVINDNSFDWEGDMPINRSLDKTIIYETHLKGFTASASSNVKNPGTYSGLIEKIPYLKSLGITAVELLPIFEFDENENERENPKTGEKLKNFWGYSTLGFFAPKCNYASNKTPGACVEEFKTLVKELHKANIEIILDVVYNHTAEGNENGYTFEFKGIENEIYYMLENDKHYYKNYSGCGNTVNTNHPVVRQFILESLRYWVLKMHVDGFRFDLASVLCRNQDGYLTSWPALTEAIAEDPILHNTKIIAEPWDAGGGYLVGNFPGERWCEWNDKFRDEIRRFVRGDENSSTAAATRMAGSSDLYLRIGKRPTSSINYITAHDGFTLNDLVSYNNKHNEENGEYNRDGSDSNYSYNNGFEGLCTNGKIDTLRLRAIKNFLVCVLLSRGTPMLLAGDEFRKTQNGNNNAYCLDTETSWVDWTLAEKNKMLIQFTSILLNLRRTHPIFSEPYFFGETEDEKKNGVHIQWYNFDGRIPEWSKLNRFLACKLLGSRLQKSDGSFDNDFYIAFNTNNHDLTLLLPPVAQNQSWVRVVDTSFESGNDDIEKEGVLSSQRNYVLPANSSVVLMCKTLI